LLIAPGGVLLGMVTAALGAIHPIVGIVAFGTCALGCAWFLGYLWSVWIVVAAALKVHAPEQKLDAIDQAGRLARGRMRIAIVAGLMPFTPFLAVLPNVLGENVVLTSLGAGLAQALVGPTLTVALALSIYLG